MLSKTDVSVEEEGRLLVERLGGRWTARGGMCRCPAHADRTPSLSVRPGRSRLLLRCFAGCDTKEVLRALAADGVLAASGPRRSSGGTAKQGQQLTAAARRIWSEARPVSGSLAQDYLGGRGLNEAADLRYHPRVPHGPRPVTRFVPAMVAAVRDDAGLVGIHRTFLRRRGDRVTAVAKLGLGQFGSGAVRLGDGGCRLGLAEGIETALSAFALFGLPCWAALGAERIPLIALPKALEELVLFLDHDEGGRRAEALARDAFPQLRIEARYPSEPGSDWNDVLRQNRALRQV